MVKSVRVIKRAFLSIILFISLLLVGCKDAKTNIISSSNPPDEADIDYSQYSYQDFIIDKIYKSEYGDVHYHIFIPKEEINDLFITLPGYNGLYFQGVGVNLKTENFAYEALKYNKNMIVLAPQLNDWNETSARQVISLTKYFQERYNIKNTYIEGYSGGGETLSYVMSMAPELYKKALHVASIWDGNIELLVKNQIPIYFVIGQNDEYYGSKRISTTYEKIKLGYKELGFDDEKINQLVTLDIKDSSYFNGKNQHGGIGAVAFDKNIMGWLFS